MISRHMKIAIVLLALIAVFLAGYNRALKKHAERLQDRMVDLRPIAPPVNAFRRSTSSASVMQLRFAAA